MSTNNNTALQTNDPISTMLKSLYERDEKQATTLTKAVYSAIRINELHPDEIMNLTREECEERLLGIGYAETLGEMTAVNTARVLHHHLTDLRTNGSTFVGKTTCIKSLTKLGEHFHIPKQRMSDYNKMIATPYYGMREFEDWVLGRFVAAYDVVNTKKKGFEGKYTYDDITHDMTIDDINALLNPKKNAIDITDGNTDGNTEGNTDGNTDGNTGNTGNTDNTDGSTNGKKPSIWYNDKKGEWQFEKCNSTDLQAFIHKYVTTDDNMDKMLISGSLKIKFPKN